MDNQEILKGKKEKVEKVTKTKNPGRVESGKRLADRNKLKRLEEKNKEHKEKIISQEEEPKEYKKPVEEKTVEVNIYKTSNVALLLLAGMIGGGIYIYRKMKTNKNEVKIKEIKPEKPDPFFME